MSEEKKISRKTLKIILGVCIGAMAALTVGFFAYIHIADTNTLGRKISIYGLDVSRLSAADAKQKILTAFQNKKIVFQENGQEVYSLALKDMGYSLDESDLEIQLTELQKKREANRKIFAKQENVNISYKVNRNAEQEKTALAADHFGDRERTASTDASIQYDDQKREFTLTSESQGDEIDESRLLSFVDQTLDEDFTSGLLDEEARITMGTECYKLPQTSADEKMQNKLADLNDQLKKYRSTTITYTFGNTTEVLDYQTIDSWIMIDGENIGIDQEAAKAYIQNLANTYNTIYVPRTFHTSYGNDVTISGNEYGFQIDQDGELAQLLEDLKSGTAVSRDPVYSIQGMQRNGTDDLAGSYIEVSLDNQHLWLYKDGALVTETDIVSGAPKAGRETYRGAWTIAYKASPYNLSRQEYGYNVKVNYWMPFVYGQGLHDASWQSSFGGNRYKSGAGSHGCINLPTDQAALIYNTIDGGYPIIIY